MKITIKYLLCLFLFVPLQAAYAYVIYTQEALLSDYFPSATVEEVVFTPDAATLEKIKATLGYSLPKTSYTFYVGKSGETVLGYTLIDEQKGQHEPITFGTLFTPDGAVSRVEILVYREAYGDGVKAESFRSQFVGATATTPLQLGKDVRIVSGATISSRSLSIGVRRATVLVAAWRGTL